MVIIERKPKDRDFILTREGLLFCVVGYLHPPHKYTAYLKYIPNKNGKWGPDKQRYQRFLSEYSLSAVRDTLEYLKGHYPQYIHHCPVREITFSRVPDEYIAEYQIPEQRLKAILADPKDRLEEETANLAVTIAEGSGISLEDLGVTGSVLSGIHQPFSDIDLTVYGASKARDVKRFLQDIMLSDEYPIYDITPEHAAQRVGSTLASHRAIGRRGAERFVYGRWNYRRFGDRIFSIHPTRLDEEIEEVYGAVQYRDAGPICIRGLITDTTQALFHPTIYACGQATLENGSPIAVRQIVSFDGIYFDAVEDGTWVMACGKLEQINSSGYQLVIGVTGIPDGGYLKPL